MLGDDPDDPGRDAARSAGPPPRARRSRRTRSSVTAAARPRSPGVEARDADGVPGRPPASDDRAAAISSRAWSRACSVDTCCFSCSVSRAADVLPATPAAAQPMASAATTARGHRKRPMTRHDTLPRRKGGPTMTTRREFLGTTTGALAGLAFAGCDLLAAAPVRAHTRRREVVVSGRRVKTVDVHAHCAVAEAMALVGMTLGAPAPPTRPELSMVTHVSERLRAMDEQGIDVEALSINPYWYKTERDLARQICQIQNSKLGEACAAHPDRFVAFATVALQYPDLAAEQLEDGVKKYGLRGAGIGGSVNGEEISDPKFDPFWAKAEQLGVLVFIHPQGSGVASEIPKRLKGNGLLGNIIGNPLETTIALSHLIFDGTLDKFPGLKTSGADERGAAHVARLVHGERPRPTHGAAVVPHHEVADAPAVRVDELPLCGVLDEVAQEGARLRHRPAQDAARVRRQVERLASRRRVRAHQALAHRREARALLVGEVGEAELLARENLRVLADQVLDLGLRLVVQRVVGRAHVGELRVAAPGRDAARVQQRVLRRDRLERAVGVPEAVADGEEPAPVVAREHLMMLVEVRYVGERGRQAVLVRRPQARADRVLELAQAAAEGQLLGVVDALVAEHEHRVLVHPGVDRRHLVRRERLAEVEPLDFGGEARADLTRRDGHGIIPGAAGSR